MAKFAFHIYFQVSLLSDKSSVIAFGACNSFLSILTFQAGTNRKFPVKENLDSETVAFGTGIITE
jgi:hypothetical protein